MRVGSNSFFFNKVIDLSQTQLKFKLRVKNKTGLTKTIHYIRLEGQRKLFKFDFAKNFERKIVPSGFVDIDIVFTHELDAPGTKYLC